MASKQSINNWDLVDLSAPRIVGPYLERRSRAPLYRLAKSKNIWRRRIAIMATFHFIRLGEFDDSFALAEAVLDDPHDLIHKPPAGCCARSASAIRNAEEAFLKKFALKMPRTMLRYAIERFLEPLRRNYLTMKP